jgi:GTP-dependent phosphoenolpyruvate carboxykinase
VIELGKIGASVVEMAAEIGVARSTIECAWPQAYPEFSEAFTQARLQSQVWWEKIGRENLITPHGQTFQSSVWSRSMAARFPADWRESSKVEQTLQNPDGSNIAAVAVTFVKPKKDSEE